MTRRRALLARVESAPIIGYKLGYSLNSGNFEEITDARYFVTGYIPFTATNNTIKLTGKYSNTGFYDGSKHWVVFYDNQKNWTKTNSQVTTATAIQNPFTFYYNTKNEDWSLSHNYDYWNKNFTSAVSSVNNAATIKTIYDPSISGFVLPKTAAFTGFTSTGGNTTNFSEYNVYGSFDNGWNFFTDGWKAGGTIFFEALGFRDAYKQRSTYTGELLYVDYCARVWSVGANSTQTAYNFNFNHSAETISVNPLDTSIRSIGFSVRSVLE